MTLYTVNFAGEELFSGNSVPITPDWMYYIRGINYHEDSVINSLRGLYFKDTGIKSFPLLEVTIFGYRNVVNVIGEKDDSFIIETIEYTKKAPNYLTVNQYNHPHLVHKIFALDENGERIYFKDNRLEIYYLPLIGKNIEIGKNLLSPITLPKKCTITISSLGVFVGHISDSGRFIKYSCERLLSKGDEIVVTDVVVGDTAGLWGKVGHKEYIPLRINNLQLQNTTDWRI